MDLVVALALPSVLGLIACLAGMALLDQGRGLGRRIGLLLVGAALIGLAVWLHGAGLNLYTDGGRLYAVIGTYGAGIGLISAFPAYWSARWHGLVLALALPATLWIWG